LTKVLRKYRLLSEIMISELHGDLQCLEYPTIRFFLEREGGMRGIFISLFLAASLVW
jgi:hypothetical protein